MGLEESLALLKQSLKRYQALNYLAKKDQNYKKPAVNKLFTTQCKEIELYLATKFHQLIASSSNQQQTAANSSNQQQLATNTSK